MGFLPGKCYLELKKAYLFENTVSILENKILGTVVIKLQVKLYPSLWHIATIKVTRLFTSYQLFFNFKNHLDASRDCYECTLNNSKCDLF